jgi:aminoglycoside/choline kinase family phosphotransferase
MSDFRSRLAKFLAAANETGEIEQLSQDASTREYFRVEWKGQSAIACVYPEPFTAAEHTYIDVTDLFLKCGLPVAKIFSVDEGLGLMILEDFGDRILRDVILNSDEDTKDKLIDDAILLIPRIQSTTKTAFETDSIASRLRFDTEKLIWELDFFKTHYFETFRKRPLHTDQEKALSAEFIEIASELEVKARVVCHRDFHAANLMLGTENKLHIIDHQDARLGSVTYDLVSLLLDRVTEPPLAEWLSEKQRVFLSGREQLGLEPIALQEFQQEFRLQTIQRCLKAVGTFSYQSAVRGKTYFIPFIQPLFQIVLNAIEDLGRFPNLARIVQEQIDEDQTRR